MADPSTNAKAGRAMTLDFQARAKFRFPDALKREAPGWWTTTMLDSVRSFFAGDLAAAYQDGKADGEAKGETERKRITANATAAVVEAHENSKAEGAAREREACMKAICHYCRIGDPYEPDKKAHRLVKGAPAMSITRYDLCSAEPIRARSEESDV